MYIYSQDQNLSELQKYEYKNEAEIQNLLFLHPEIVLELREQIPEFQFSMNIPSLVCREFPLSGCGCVDLMIVTEDADIILIETKLLRNPESSRTVVAQIIDYIKSFVTIDVEKFINTAEKLKNCKIKQNIKNDDRFLSKLKKNFESGNICGIILGDNVNDNVFELIESIQAAPQLSFCLNLVSLNTYTWNGSLIFDPIVFSQTKEVERSVITVHIDCDTRKTSVESSIPTRDEIGSKPLLTWNEYLSNFDDKDKIDILRKFYKEWDELETDDGIHMGTVGFSAGVVVNGRRIPIQFTYDDNLEIITENSIGRYGISVSDYKLYKDDMKQYPDIYDKYIIANKKIINFKDISNSEFAGILQAAYYLGKRLKQNK